MSSMFVAPNGDTLDVITSASYPGRVIVSAHNGGDEQPVGAYLDPQDAAGFLAAVLHGQGVEALTPDMVNPELSAESCESMALAFLFRAQKLRAQFRDASAKSQEIHETTQEIRRLLTDSDRNGYSASEYLAEWIVDNYTRNPDPENGEPAESGPELETRGYDHSEPDRDTQWVTRDGRHLKHQGNGVWGLVDPATGRTLRLFPWGMIPANKFPIERHQP